MTIKDLLIEKGRTSIPKIERDIDPYLNNAFLLERGPFDPMFRRYYYKTKILTKSDNVPLAHNPSIKLLWLMGLI